MDFVTDPPPHLLQLFEEGLWKDRRVIELDVVDGVKVLRKSSMLVNEVFTERTVIETLAADDQCHVPRIVSCAGDGITLEYTEGSRLFNVLVELDRLPEEYSDAASAARSLLLARAESQQARIQGHLFAIRDVIGRRMYPISRKTTEILLLLSSALGIQFPYDLLEDELEKFEAEWHTLCSVPFRDATPKNMVVAAADLWLGNFDGEGPRSEYIEASFREAYPNLPEWVYSPIVDFDFGSCEDLTTPEDDPISLLCHQRTWHAGIAEPHRLLWLDEVKADARRCALTFLVRYGRFGGRKAAYRLLHSSGFRVRFRHDDDRFYFDRLPVMVQAIDASIFTDYPLLMGLIETIGRRLATTRPVLDYFRDYRRDAHRRYYVDIFPY